MNAPAHPLAEIPFLRALGARLGATGPGTAEITLAVVPEHQNSLGMAHGGVVMTLLDVAMARAGRTLVIDEEGQAMTAVTVEMKTSFFRPALGDLVARGKVLHRSASMVYCEAELIDGGGHVAAKSLGTFKYVRRRDSAAQSKSADG